MCYAWRIFQEELRNILDAAGETIGEASEKAPEVLSSSHLRVSL